MKRKQQRRPKRKSQRGRESQVSPESQVERASRKEVITWINSTEMSVRCGLGGGHDGRPCKEPDSFQSGSQEDGKESLDNSFKELC